MGRGHSLRTLMVVLSISDHYRKDKLIGVTDWHVDTLCRLGWEVIDWEKVDTPRNRYGSNRDLRAPHESVVLLELPQ